MKHRKTFNGYLPSVDVKGTLDNPNYNFVLEVPIVMKQGYDRKNEYDCFVDPFEEFDSVIDIASVLFNMFGC